MSREARQMGHYMNFILNALTGHNPDWYFDEFRADIESAWKRVRFAMAGKAPVLEPVHRGIMLDPTELHPEAPVCQPLGHIRYLSFSEDREVARVFADPLHQFGLPMRMRRPHFRGYLMEHLPEPREILFHWRWSQALSIERFLGAENMYHIHEQKEVMLANTGRSFPVQPVAPGSANPELGRIWR